MCQAFGPFIKFAWRFCEQFVYMRHGVRRGVRQSVRLSFALASFWLVFSELVLIFCLLLLLFSVFCCIERSFSKSFSRGLGVVSALFLCWLCAE